MVELYERLNDFVVEVNHYPFHRTEVIDKHKGIVRVYGKDGSKEKINSVRYSKPYYTEAYIRENILSKYEDCPLCRIGQDIKKPIKRELPNNTKLPAILMGVAGIFSIPLLLYAARKKLTK